MTCKSVGVWDLRAPPKVPKGVRLAATTKMPSLSAWPIDILNLMENLKKIKLNFEYEMEESKVIHLVTSVGNLKKVKN